MRAARFFEPHTPLRVEDVEPPRPRSGEALITVKAVGICGSDVHIVQGHTPTGFTPITLGHEISGVVAEVNSESGDVRVGDRVFVNPMIGCGTCRFCTEGEVNFCAARKIIGIQREGALSEFVTAPLENLTVIPSHVSFPEAALIESAGTSNHAVRVLNIGAGDVVVVIGTGGLGMQALRLAIARGATVYAVDTDPEARARSIQAGAADAFDPRNVDLKEGLLHVAHRPEGIDSVIDCVGTQPTFELALSLLRLNGHCALIGIGPEALTLTPPAHFMRRALRVSGIYGYTSRDIAQVAESVANGSLDLKASVSATLPLERVNDALQMFSDRTNSPVRVIIEP